MSPNRWRTAFASSTGTSHDKTGAPCQDACGCRVVIAPDGTEVLLATVSDGAGTAPKSEVGSAIAVAFFLDKLCAICTDHPVATIDAVVVAEWFQALRAAIRRQADADAQPINHYACTFLGAIVGEKSSAYIQLGDGAIVVKAKAGTGQAYEWIFWPQHGEYANSTYFVTQDGVEPLLQVKTGVPVDEIALFTDGIERLVLDMTQKTVHGPAFKPVFDWLATTAPDPSGQPSSALKAYLDSDHINRRTDDDKSLVMATRAQVPTGPVADTTHADD